MRALRLLPLLLVVLAVAACASSHVLTGTPRPPIDPAQVRIYHGPPPGGYEEIAILETSSGAFTYGDQNKTDAILRKLREEAASLGANGVLFQGTADGYGGSGVSVGAGGGRVGGSSFGGAGVGVNISPRQKYASGLAIHVPNPPPETAPGTPPQE
ncbi:hypothetical protein H0E84_19865 [Luteimonas sp. SJ-92]|uniref:DUF4156 domain-containing protein n=1 Tax=Luteimonas salinisoli TaxID=2752307 RepID=A0A853JGW9_9GAMM|nr:hypothetical protein [Luteimonas salinisoli]NZA28636.1 hypothetical protein [Luteimonas salinisoli]